jgi:hypothetical protein
MKDVQALIKKQIIAALSHVEAEEGLYFNNLIVVHEEEERPIVAGDEVDVRKTLAAMITEGSVVCEGSGDTAVYRLAA